LKNKHQRNGPNCQSKGHGLAEIAVWAAGNKRSGGSKINALGIAFAFHFDY